MCTYINVARASGRQIQACKPPAVFLYGANTVSSYQDKKMISHVLIGVNDFNRALTFYQPLMQLLGLDLKFKDLERPWAGWKHPDTPRPLFVVGTPFDGEAATPGNGQMIALLADNRQTVRSAHALALALDGICEGAPGLRPEYHPDFYGAYFRDPEGNKLCVCCHDPE